MKRILLLVLLLPVLAFGQKLREAVKVKTPVYEVVYNEKLEQPTWIQYTVQCPNGTASRAGMDFYVNDSIKTSDAADYVNNVYDKGHLAPAADFNCTKELLYQTFSYLNCALQNQYLKYVYILHLKSDGHAKQLKPCFHNWPRNFLTNRWFQNPNRW